MNQNRHLERKTMKAIVGCTALFLLAACDSGGVVDQTVRQGVRQSAVQACTAWVPQSEIAQAAGLNTDTLCGCAADRLLKGKSASELGNLRPGSAETRQAVAQCIADMRSPAPAS